MQLFFKMFQRYRVACNSLEDMEVPEIERDCVQLSRKVSVERKTPTMGRLISDVRQVAMLVGHSNCQFMFHVEAMFG